MAKKLPEWFIKILRQEAEGYRALAFPTAENGCRRIGSGGYSKADDQRQALVARGRYFACQDLLNRFAKQGDETR